MADRTLSRKIEALKRNKIAARKVVSLEDFRKLRKNQESRSILVVDDDEIMRNGLKRVLESQGFRVLMAEDGLELSKVLESTQLDLVLLDVNLPWVDGFELCKLIKGHYSLRKVPLILVSARKNEEDVERGLYVGADDYVTKPFEIDDIIEVINRRLVCTAE